MKQLPSQIISLEGERYAIPQENLKELVRIPAADIKKKIDKVGSMPVVRLRNEFLPLLDLADVLDVEKTYVTENGQIKRSRRKQIADRRSVQHLSPKKDSDQPSKTISREGPPQGTTERQKNDRRKSSQSAVNIAIVFSEGYTYGLVVDQFHEAEEIPGLPVGRYLSEAGIYKGTTILNDESAALILDIENIALISNLSVSSATVDEALSHLSADKDSGLEDLSLFTFRNSETEYFAVDLEYVQRLERFYHKSFQEIGTRSVVQYRCGSLPVLELSQILNCGELTHSDPCEVVVFRHGETLMGLKVYPPVDTVQCRTAVDRASFNTPPVIGTVILNNKTTRLLDVPAMINLSQRESA